MPYVNHRWLGGLLTNWNTISTPDPAPARPRALRGRGPARAAADARAHDAQADLAKLQANLGGVKDMQRVPDAMFVVDLKTEVIAVREAQRLRIPIIGLVDTNCDPDGIALRRAGQRRRDPLVRADHQARSASVVEEGAPARAASPRSRRAARPRRRPAASRRSASAARPRSRRAARPRRPPRAAEQAARRRGRRRPRRRPPSRASPPAPAPAGRRRRPGAGRGRAGATPAAPAPRLPRRPRSAAGGVGRGRAAARLRAAERRAVAEERAGAAAPPRRSPATWPTTAAETAERRRPRRAEAEVGARTRPPRAAEVAEGRRRGRRQGRRGRDRRPRRPSDREERRVRVSITAQDVKALRDRTGAGMMECKRALQETDGDMEKADRAAPRRGRRQGGQARRARGLRGHRRSPTSTRTARSACSSRSTARPTSWPATTTSSPSPATSRCTSPPRAPLAVTEDERPGRGARARAAHRRRAGRGGGQAREHRREDRRGQAATSGSRRSSCSRQEHVNDDKHDGKTIEELRAGALGQDGRERRDPPLRALRGRRVADGARRAPAYKRVLLKLSGEALMGELRVRHRPRARRTRSPRQIAARAARAASRSRVVVGGGQHLPRPRRRGGGHGPRHRRLHGDARHGAERAGAAGRAREAGRRHARAVGDHDLRGRRAVHPPPRDAPPREGARRHLRGRHRQPVLHHRHRRGAAGRRDPRRGHPDGQERRRGRLHGRPARRRRRPSSSPRSRTWRRSSAACA